MRSALTGRTSTASASPVSGSRYVSITRSRCPWVTYSAITGQPSVQWRGATARGGAADLAVRDVAALHDARIEREACRACRPRRHRRRHAARHRRVRAARCGSRRGDTDGVVRDRVAVGVEHDAVDLVGLCGRDAPERNVVRDRHRIAVQWIAPTAARRAQELERVVRAEEHVHRVAVDRLDGAVGAVDQERSRRPGEPAGHPGQRQPLAHGQHHTEHLVGAVRLVRHLAACTRPERAGAECARVAASSRARGAGTTTRGSRCR